MSKIKFQGNASGTGVLTITSPNTNADRTITLPDEDVTLGGGVDGIVSNADATAMTITSSENIGIGTASPTQKLHVAGNIYNTGYLNTAGSGTAGGVQFADGNAMIYRDTNDMVFKLQGAEKIRLPSSGGITFNGDTSAQNTLHDYEEGTWTPTFSSNIAFSTKLHFTYTKIGSIVKITGYCNGASGTFGTSWSVSGLPYTSSGSYNTAPLWSHGQDQDYMMYMESGNSVMNIRDRDDANMDSMSEISFDCVYLTNQ